MRATMMLVCVLAVAATLPAARGFFPGAQPGAHGMPPDQPADSDAARSPLPTAIPASPNVLELNEMLWWPNVEAQHDKVYYVQYYATHCRACKRIASDWSDIADEMKARDRQVVIARVECEANERFCTSMGVERTPTFKVYHKGREVYEYRAEIFIRDMLEPFVVRFKEDLMAGRRPPLVMM